MTGANPVKTMRVTVNAAETIRVAVNGANIEVDADACTPAATTAGVCAIVVNADLLTDCEDQNGTFDGTGGFFNASIGREGFWPW